LSDEQTLLFDKKIDPSSEDISLLLSPLDDMSAKNECLLLKQGWWTVEFCYGKFIRQIHLEPRANAKINKRQKGQKQEWDMTQEHVIGRWNASVIVDANSFTIHKNENEPKRTYASIVYGYGDECDLSRNPRQTEIQFYCGLNLQHSELKKAREDPSCEYIAQVYTPLLCAHPSFKVPSAPSREIVCYPFDDKEFGENASAMKEVADIQAESDAILNLVMGTATDALKTEL